MVKKWFVDVGSDDKEKKVQLFCFPFAGGGVSAFKKWNEHINDYIHLSVLALPGREIRFSEPPVRDMNFLIGELASNLIDKIEPPYLFFGHSMGAIIAFELLHELISRGVQPPDALIVSARGSESNVRGGLSALKELEAQQLEKLSSSLGSKLNKTLINQLKKLTTASLENDFALCSTLDLDESKVLDIPIYGLYGTNDKYANTSNMLNWQNKTTASFALNEIAGDHFFMMDNAKDTCKSINSIIQDSLI